MTSPPQLVLVGDSDIAYWPRDLYPNISSQHDVLVSGHSGASLEEVVPKLKQLLMSSKATSDRFLVVGCAGENDIGRGLSLDKSVSALELFLDTAFAQESIDGVIFLGPKFEPWLSTDTDSRKQYSAMSRSFQRCCQQHPQSGNIFYMDCLTTFCGETANLPGAVLGGKAIPDPIFFANDGLHLSDRGYSIWKAMIESVDR